MAHAIDGKLGVILTRTTTTQERDLGDKVLGDDGITYIYVQANGAKTQYLAYIVDEAFQLQAGLTTTNAADAPIKIGFPQMSGGMADNDYGYVAIQGPLTCTVAASCAADVELQTTATIGVLDDAATTEVFGIKLTAANGGSQAAVAADATNEVAVTT